LGSKQGDLRIMLVKLKDTLRSSPTVRSLWINSEKARYAFRSSLIERGVWFEHGVGFDRAAPLRDVADLVAELQPKAISKPLRRFGTGADGGYLMPDDLDGVSACISPGVSTQVGFDLEIAERGIDVHLTDGSVSGPPIQHERFHFTKKFLDTYNSETTITLDD
jgi:hypothetical protein